ncbi:benzoate 4-monooxygenase cytochrome p450 [Grosmannia clavigera kw1407]|uniref:Benzoate 4-monooxygenase cytochrome p450 n=1 Tax=Grosmannia clavigera (strain kw1407 / UAMH 11150) TaxID=655863 RepID=F0XCT9_GROCL|nr:benzoate 4-monooxygenase cytochrome p450 [Grosmannia clavigera kw1407]EFX04226.1 benzoate 4-monooxygenase cytochrome p450 [Grosmannia clavigera kw1407]
MEFLSSEKKHSFNRPLVGATVLVVVLVWFLVIHFTSPLRTFPGPFWARWTNIWRLYQVSTDKYQWTIKRLHEKYGPVVRIGPNLLDLDYPELIQTLYSTDGKWNKTEFYQSLSVVVDGKITHDVFSTSNQAEHARMKRPIVKYYSMSSVLKLETRANDVLSDLCRHLEHRFMDGENEGKDCNFGEWIAFYTWDFISAATLSTRFGFMEKADDVDDTIRISDKGIHYFAMVGQMPFLDFLLAKNPIKRIGPPNLQNANRIALEHMFGRFKEDLDSKEVETRDFLDHFIEAKKMAPDSVDENLIMCSLLVNLIAGADTTATTLRAIFHFLMTNPHTLKKLEQEVLAANFEPEGVVPYSSARALPYLDAVIRESMRMHPAVCMPLERYVPDSGLTLPDGSFVPSGTAVGINPYIVGRNEGVWGPDANEFLPERWLKNDGEDNDTYKRRLRQMNAADLAFGGGSRICLGRNVALLEIYKVVATLVLRYKILPSKVPKEFVIFSSWFSRQLGLVCRLEKRQVT